MKNNIVQCGVVVIHTVYFTYLGFLSLTSLMTSLFFRILIDNIGLQQEQRIVIKFLVAEGVSSAEIHHRLVFKDDSFMLTSRVFE